MQTYTYMCIYVYVCKNRKTKYSNCDKFTMMEKNQRCNVLV